MQIKVVAAKGFYREVGTGEFVDVKTRDGVEKVEKQKRENFAYGQVLDVDGAKITADHAADWIEKGLCAEVD